MKEMVNSILECILDARKIPEEMLYEFSKMATKIVQNGCTEVIPEEFWELESYVQTYWRGEKYLKSDDAVQIYQMGRLLSFTNMLAMLAEHKEKEVSIEDYVVQLKDKYIIFKEIQNRPGITHKELADVAGMSVSSLSQFVNKYKLHGFFRGRTMGREKHYYLTDYGQQLYSAMKDRYEKITLSDYRKALMEWTFLDIINNIQYESLANKRQIIIKNNVHLPILKRDIGNMVVFSERNKGRNYLTLDGVLGGKELSGENSNKMNDWHGKNDKEGLSWRTNKSLKMQELAY